MKLTRSIAVASIVAACAWIDVHASGKPTALVIAERGKPASCSIVLPSDPEPSRQYAAEELRDYVKQITGVALPVVTNATPACAVYLDRAGKELGDDAFRLKAQGGGLHVVGGKRGILYGVYEILERFGGVGWFASWRTVVPEAASFAVPSALDETHRPAFRFRATSWGDVRSRKGEVACHEFRTRMRMNGFGSEDSKFGLRFGGEEFRFTGRLGTAHTFGKLVPQKKYFKEHPEYYSEVNGVRRDGQTQLCLTNPDVLEIVVSNVLAAIAVDPTANVAGVSQDDWANYCTCPKCKAIDEEEESHAGTLVRFLNKVAERVCAVHPEMYIETLAYQYTRKPPKKTRLHPRVVPCLCSIECDFSRPIGSGLKKANEAFRRDIKGWAKLTDNLYLWDYTTDYRHYLHPFGNVPVLQDNIRFFRDNGVKFLFEEGGSRHADFAEFKAWLLLKWMWNPEQPFQPLADRFMEGYFGKAAPFAKEYLRRYLERCKTETTRHLGCFAFDAPEVFPDDFIEWALDNWIKAEEAVKDDRWGLYAVRMAEAVPLATMLDRWTAKAPRVFVTRHPEKTWFPAKARFAYERLMGIMAEAKSYNHDMRLGNLAVRHDLPLRNWKTLVEAKRPSAPCDRGIVTSREFDCWSEYRAKEESDPDATGGKAMRVVNYINDTGVYFNISNLAYDRDAEYRIRIRVKVERVEGGKGEAFRAHLGRKNIVAVNVKDVPDDTYRWYDLGTAKLTPDMVFEFSNGRFANGGGRTAVKATWIDCLEFTRKEQ